ncbi:MAG: hypothetical protein WD274_09855 [Acidimicrobiia bacterium]
MRTSFLLPAAELAAKVEWEGGIIPALEYGIRYQHIEDPEVARLWAELEQRHDELAPLVTQLEKLLFGSQDSN